MNTSVVFFLRCQILLLEHDAKILLSRRGLTVPEGDLTDVTAPGIPSFSAPWVVKAQVPAGGRGKAGGIRIVEDKPQLWSAARALSCLTIGGFPVREVRIEQAVQSAAELYIGLVVDAAVGDVVVMASASGGVDVEAAADDAHIVSRRAPLDRTALIDAMAEVASGFTTNIGDAFAEVGAILIDAFLDLDATLVEVNPLFVLPGGDWIAGDLRLDLDLNALDRQPSLADLIDARQAAYADAAFKKAHGYDLVVTDPQGQIGLVATGAGLSMQLLDEMTRRGMEPYNFCDIRSGMMRGDPARLIENLTALKQGENLRCVLVNIFAGITELGEFATLLLQALEAVPDLRIPLIVRLVGNGQDRADEILRAATNPGLMLERDLDRALDLCAEACNA
jgi:succinyl-CoA synthetase beta subunit